MYVHDAESKSLESSDRLDRIVEQIKQSWNDRLESPPTKTLERYARHRRAIALKEVCDFGWIKFGVCPLITFDGFLHSPGENPRSSTTAEDKFSVFIDDVEPVDDKEGVIRRIGGVVRLKSFDHVDDIGVFDPLYFSFKSLNVFSLARLFIEYWKLNPFIFVRGSDGEMPNDMVEAGAKVMNDLSSEHVKSLGDSELSVILDCLQKQLAVVLWHNGVIAFLKESGDFRLEIEDVLFGPY